MTYRRDAIQGLPWPGFHDLPGGGREGDETPEACLLRELEEEFGLRLPASRLEHRLIFPPMLGGPLPAVFFGGQLRTAEVAAIRFGPEGQSWQMMDWRAFLRDPQTIPALRPRVQQMAELYGFAT